MKEYPLRFWWRTFLIGIIASCPLMGCEGIAAYGVGKVYLDKERAAVFITENEEDISGCDLIKQVKASTSWGGLALQDQALQRVISDLTHEANEAGANVLLIKNKSKSFMGSSASGDAYRCNNVENMPAASDR